MSFTPNAEQPGSILFLKSGAGTLLAPEIFLKNRGWLIRSFVDIRDAVAAVVQSPPDFILVCADHSNTQAQALPHFFQRNFGIRSIAYFDRYPAHAKSILDLMQTPYALYPVVSGPSIERMVFKVRRDLQIADVRERERALLEQTPPSNFIKIKQAAAEAPANLFQIFEGRRSAQQILSPDQSIVRQGAKFAVEEVRPPAYEDDITVLENGTRVACLILQSSRFSGYLIAALGKNRTLNSQFFKTISARLTAFLKANGEKMCEHEPMSLILQSVKFNSWSIEQAEFLEKASHGDDEMSMAFFPFHQTEIETQDSAVKEMCTISIDDLVADVTLDFDLYLNLPVNNRNILYTPRGNVFYGQQKDRLKKNGIERMSLTKSDAPNLLGYRAKNYLNSRIEQFLSEKNSGKS
jgi:hypothetical protein